MKSSSSYIHIRGSEFRFIELNTSILYARVCMCVPVHTCTLFKDFFHNFDGDLLYRSNGLTHYTPQQFMMPI